MLSSLETPYFRIEHVCQSRSRSRQGEASDQEDGEHDVGEERGEVDDVARGLDALHGDQEHDDPSGQQAEHHPPPDAVESVDVRGDVQRLAVPGFAEKKEKIHVDKSIWFEVVAVFFLALTRSIGIRKTFGIRGLAQPRWSFVG